MEPSLAWMVTWSSLTFSSFEFCSANASSDCVSWNCSSVLCMGPPQVACDSSLVGIIQARMKEGYVRGLAITAIVGSWLFTVDWLVAPLWQDHYSVIDQAVSEMGGNTANLPWLLNAGIVAMGVALLACAAAVWMVLPRNGWRPLISAPLAVAGVAGVVSAFATMDCSTTVNRACFDRAVAGTASWHEYAHSWAYVVGGVALTISSLAVAGALRRRRPLLAIAPAVGGGLGIALWVTEFTADPKFDPHMHYGIYQRIGLLVSAGWVQLLAAAVLIRLEEKRRASSPAWASAAPPTWSAARPTRPSA